MWELLSMSSLASQELTSVEQYIAGEQDSDVRHEYVAGHVYAMVGASVYHNRIALALASELRTRLKGRSCDVFLSDMKLRVGEAFYYPDVMVCCDAADDDLYTKTRPIFIAEIISPASRTTDEREKRAAYQSLPGLQTYLLLEQDRAEARLYRRQDARWVVLHIGPEGVIDVPSLALAVSVQTLYEGAW